MRDKARCLEPAEQKQEAQPPWLSLLTLALVEEEGGSSGAGSSHAGFAFPAAMSSVWRGGWQVLCALFHRV